MKIHIINDSEDFKRLSTLKDSKSHNIFVDITKKFGIIIDNEETALVFKLFDVLNNTSISNIEKLIAEIYNNLMYCRENKNIVFLDLKEANKILPIKADDIKILSHINGNISILDSIATLDNYSSFQEYFESRVKIYKLVKNIKYTSSLISEIIYSAIPAYVEMESIGLQFDPTIATQLKIQNVKNNKVYFDYNIIGTITGRTSSKIHPLSKDIKKFIYPNKDCVFVEFDYNAAEARILAHYSEDENLLDIFKNDNDLHKINAALIFNKKEEGDITNQERSVAKLVFFSIINGISLSTLQKDLKKYKIDEDTTKKIKLAIQKIYNRAWSWIDTTQKDAIINKKTINMFGRIRDLTTEIVEDESRAKKQASNTIIQSTLSDIKLIALHDIYEKYKNILVAEFHDSIIVQLKFDNHINIVIKEIANIMSNIGIKYNLKCPLKCNFEIKRNL